MINRLRMNKGKRIEIELLNGFKLEGVNEGVKEIKIKDKVISYLAIKPYGKDYKLIKIDDIEGLIIYGENLK